MLSIACFPSRKQLETCNIPAEQGHSSTIPLRTKLLHTTVFWFWGIFRLRLQDSKTLQHEILGAGWWCSSWPRITWLQLPCGRICLHYSNYFPGIHFGIALHSLYHKYLSAEIILLYITLSWPQPLSCPFFVFTLHCIKRSEGNSCCDTLHYGYSTNIFRILSVNNSGRPVQFFPWCGVWISICNVIPFYLILFIGT